MGKTFGKLAVSSDEGAKQFSGSQPAVWSHCVKSVAASTEGKNKFSIIIYLYKQKVVPAQEWLI